MPAYPVSMTTFSGKGSKLTTGEMDTNFTRLRDAVNDLDARSDFAAQAQSNFCPNSDFNLRSGLNPADYGSNFVGNPTCEGTIGQTAPASWTPYGSTIQVISGGRSGNCIEVKLAAANRGLAQYLPGPFRVGSLYRLSVWVRGTASSNGQTAELRACENITDVKKTSETVTLDDGTAGWMFLQMYFRATRTTHHIYIVLNGAIDDVFHVDDANWFEVAPSITVPSSTNNVLLEGGWGCIGGGTGNKLTVFEDDTAPGGTAHAILCEANTVANAQILLGFTHKGEQWWLEQFRGRQVTVGAWIKCSTASTARILIFYTDGNGVNQQVTSAYHTGGGAYELITKTFTIPDDATVIYFNFIADNLTICKPVLTYGNYIGNDYQPAPLRFWPIQNPILADTAPFGAGTYSGGTRTISVLEDTKGRISDKRLMMVRNHIRASDSGSATAADNGACLIYALTSDGLVGPGMLDFRRKDSGQAYHGVLDVPVRDDGNQVIQAGATGTDTLTLHTRRYVGVIA